MKKWIIGLIVFNFGIAMHKALPRAITRKKYQLFYEELVNEVKNTINEITQSILEKYPEISISKETEIQNFKKLAGKNKDQGKAESIVFDATMQAIKKSENKLKKKDKK